MPDVPVWRFDDLAAYDAMRDAAMATTTMLLTYGDVAAAALDRRKAVSVDGFRRAEIDAVTWDQPTPTGER